MFGLFRKSESRARVTQSKEDFWVGLLGGSAYSVAGKAVTTEAALGLPSMWAAVNFLSGTLAGLPLHVYRMDGRDRTKDTGLLSSILGKAPNAEQSSFEWRKAMFEDVFTTGRAFTYIERNNANRVVNLFPLEPSRVTVRMTNAGRVYDYRQPDGGMQKYSAAEVIDLPFMLKPDRCGHYGPIHTCREAIGLAMAAQSYGERSFLSGGIPAATISGPFSTGAAAERASDDLSSRMAAMGEAGKSVMAIPAGHDFNVLGFKPQDMQSIEFQRFSVEQIARIYSLPPIFLQDLTKGTYANTEQQDLHFVKHTLKRWIEQAEQEINLKLFPRGSKQYVEFNVDGLLRGDFKTRMDAHATSIQNAIRTPNEVRAIENIEEIQGGDRLMVQGATVPIEAQGQLTEAERSQIALNEATSRALNGQS